MMKSFWLLLIAFIAGGITVVALDLSGTMWSSLIGLAWVCALLGVYTLRSWWHAALGMGVAMLFLPPLAGESRSPAGLVVMALGLCLTISAAYFVQSRLVQRSL